MHPINSTTLAAHVREIRNLMRELGQHKLIGLQLYVGIGRYELTTAGDPVPAWAIYRAVESNLCNTDSDDMCRSIARHMAAMTDVSELWS